MKTEVIIEIVFFVATVSILATTFLKIYINEKKKKA